MIDCHAHLTSEAFNEDLVDVLKNAGEVGINRIIVVSENLSDAKKALEICKSREDFLMPGAGFHPDLFSEEKSAPSEGEMTAFCDFVKDNSNNLACIGEVGLDYWYVESVERRRMQADFLKRLVNLSLETDLPLNVHSRSAGKYALALLAEHGAKRVLMHGFDGKAGYALKAALEQGFLFSIPTSVVRSAQKQKLVKTLPLAVMVLETDSPVLGPDKEKRNEPANLTYALEYIASAKKMTPEKIDEVTTENAMRLFGIA